MSKITALVQPDLAPTRAPVVPRTRPGPTSTVTGLLVSANEHHATRLNRAALVEGWNMDECSTLPEAMKMVFRKKYELALVDLESVFDTCHYADYEQLAADLARNHIPLLIVLGPDSDPLAEMNARQLGVWVYLSGFDQRANFKQLFREARQAVKQLSGRNEALSFGNVPHDFATSVAVNHRK